MSRTSTAGAFVALTALTLGARDASGQTASPASPATGPNEARGWAQEPTTPGEDAALLLPRALLTPPRLILKALFWPIQHGLRAVERHAVVERIQDVLYNDERTAGILPTFSFITSQGPSVGLKLFHNDLGGHKESITFEGSFGGQYVQAYQLGFKADDFLGKHVWLETRTRVERDPGLLFQGYGDAPPAAGATGLGPREASEATRYQETRFLNMLRLGYTFGHPGAELKIGASAILNHRDFAGAQGQTDPSTTSVYDTSQIPGFDSGVRTGEFDGNVVLDLRDAKGQTGSGAYVELFGGGVPRAGAYHYGHYGGEASAYLNLYKKTRVLVLRVAHEAVVGDQEAIPFSDLPRLGGPYRLRGFDLDHFRDRTTALGTLEYHYPIHDNIAGSLFIDAGHVGADYRALMRMEDWRIGGGGGFIVRTKKSILFTIDVAYGGDGLQLYVATDPLRAFAGRDEQL